MTDNSRDLPPGEERAGVLFLSTAGFLAALYRKFPDAEAALRAYASEGSQG